MESLASADPARGALADLLALVGGSSRLMVLTGAGCSTESGIPDYRAEDGRWKTRQPMSYAEFTGSEKARQRYWAGSLIGWRRIAEARPNAAHRALADLEAAGRVQALVTQNVDGLHQRAGSRRVIDLHGRLDAVSCLECRAGFPRRRFQRELEQANPEWAGLRVAVAPDGDARLAPTASPARTDFVVPHCPLCRGVLKPGVVFFGESVPRERVEQAFARLGESDALLVVGSSLVVWSGYRFVREARRLGMPVAALICSATGAAAV